ncbi:uncharacterized protein LTR77_003179 [Saxophila tyrrhenica]|uniref:Uncharacterized protein n=1 Tax=Saxophila tyrrhenica TaxID=1690608 RepID=A0AAV9PJT7_9PEZI|nr:hypothetical protein LTR77_003179 [Saxophila tyrrhenica]
MLTVDASVIAGLRCLLFSRSPVSGSIYPPSRTSNTMDTASLSPSNSSIDSSGPPPTGSPPPGDAFLISLTVNLPNPEDEYFLIDLYDFAANKAGDTLVARVNHPETPAFVTRQAPAVEKIVLIFQLDDDEEARATRSVDVEMCLRALLPFVGRYKFGIRCRIGGDDDFAPDRRELADAVLGEFVGMALCGPGRENAATVVRDVGEVWKEGVDFKVVSFSEVELPRDSEDGRMPMGSLI